MARGDDPDIGPRVMALLERTAEHATPGTRGFGEVTVAVDDGMGGRRASQRVSNPHLWEGTLFYLSLMAMEDPDALLRDDLVLPPSRVPAPFTRATGGSMGGTVGGAGCDCETAPRGNGATSAAAFVGLVGAAVLVAARCRRRSKR
jgi:hypothetical protein